jgi:predicted dinucleotide-binding enzyme
MAMNIGIIGSGNVGGNLGTLWARAGHEVFFSSRHPDRLAGLVEAAGPRARRGTVAEAALFGEVLLFAPNYWSAGKALEAAGPLDGKVLIDATNPYKIGGGGLVRALPETTTAAAEFAKSAPGARVVKAYSNVPADYLTGGPERRRGLAVFFCGDDPAARAVVASLIADSGFEPLDIGPLARAGEIEIPGRLQKAGMLPVEEARKLLG